MGRRRGGDGEEGDAMQGSDVGEGRGGVNANTHNNSNLRDGKPAARFSQSTKNMILAVSWCLLCVLGFGLSWSYRKVSRPNGGYAIEGLFCYCRERESQVRGAGEVFDWSGHEAVGIGGGIQKRQNHMDAAVH
jgi:hypothetical protein